MATYLSVPLKKTFQVEMKKSLTKFILETFSDLNPEEYNQSITEFDNLRNQMTKAADKRESTLEILYRYYDQLVAIENKLPMAENAIRINFKWQDAFEKEGFFGGKSTAVIASGAYEKACLLFNIAALQSQIAEVQNHSTDDGLKLSAKLLSQAAGIFSHLSTVVMSDVQQIPTPDLSQETMRAVSAVMLAQAQESYCMKAIADKMKDAIIAKCCMQCSDFYSSAMNLVQNSEVRQILPQEWVSVVAGKQALYHGLAEFYQSEIAIAAHSYGEAIARLQHADELLKAAITRGGKYIDVTSYHGKIQRSLAAVQKDNNFIYNDRVPRREDLAAIGKATLAKPTPVAGQMSNNFHDLFEKLVPLPVHQALTTFEQRKAEIVNFEVGRLREQTQLMNSVLASLNLPAAIEDLGGAQVPQSVHEKAIKIQNEGGISLLNTLMGELPELLVRNREILDESMKQLDDEQRSDDQLREQFKSQWTRTPSMKLTEPIRMEGSKYRQILDNAIQADNIVKTKYNEHKAAIEMLSTPGELQKKLPSANPAAALKDSKTVVELRKLLEQVEGIKAERDAIEMEIKEAKSQMTSKFMGALAQDGAINEESLSLAELDRVYGPLREQVQDSINRQEAVMINIERVNMDFTKERSASNQAATRDQMLKDLAAGYDSFMELKSNLQEGSKFYNDLTQLLVRFQTKVSDFCFARKTEKDDLMKDLQTSIANRPTDAPPSTPAYQQPNKPQPAPRAGKKAAPERPPPPTLPAQGTQPPSTQTLPAAGAAAAASAPSAPSTQPAQQLPYQPQPYNYGAPPAGSYQPQYPAYPTYAPPPMPTGYNPYGAYGQYSQQQAQGAQPGQAPYPQQQYPQQGNAPYPQQQYPQQPYPQQQYQQQQYPQQGYGYQQPPYPPQ